MTWGIGGFIALMLFIIWKLAIESKAGRFGTFVLFFVLAFGILGFRRQIGHPMAAEVIGAPATVGASDWRFCVAPMMDWTDRHCRYFHRQISSSTRALYTEMVTTGALLHGDAARHLHFDAAEHPVALQLGGSEPDELARAARLGRAGRLRRDQSELRLSVRTRAAWRLRRLPDGRAGTGGRLRQGDARRGRRSGHGQAPHRHRPRRRLRLRARLCRRAARRGLPGVHRARTQRLAPGTEPEGKPRSAAAALRDRASAEARLSAAAFVLNGGLQSLDDALAASPWA